MKAARPNRGRVSSSGRDGAGKDCTGENVAKVGQDGSVANFRYMFKFQQTSNLYGLVINHIEQSWAFAVAFHFYFFVTFLNFLLLGKFDLG